MNKKPAKNAKMTKLAQSLAVQLGRSLGEAGLSAAFETPAGSVARGKIFQTSGYLNEAAASYSEALESKTHADEAAARLAIVQIISGQFDQALATATALASRNPGFEVKELTSTQRFSALTILGDALVHNGRFNEAIDAYKGARKASKKDNFAAARLAQLYLATGEPKKAAALAADFSGNPRFRELSSVLSLGQQSAALLPDFTTDSLTSRFRVAMPGRPLLVQDAPVLAPIVRGDDRWCA